MMDELDNIIRQVMKDKYPEGSFAGGEDCLSEERFADYLENLLDLSQKEEVEKHLAGCESCFQKSILFSRMINEIKNKQQMDVPGNITEKAKRLVREKYPEDMIEVVLEMGKNIIKVIKDAAGICTVPDPALLSMRNIEDRERGTYVARIQKEFNGIAADISVEKTHDRGCDIVVRVSDATSGGPLDDIRVNLVFREKELASYLTVKGHAAFKNLNIDTYVLQIHKGKAPIGSVMVTLTSA